MQEREGRRSHSVSRRSAMRLFAGGAAAAATFAAAEVGTAYAVPLPSQKPQWVEPGFGDEVRTISFEHQWSGEKLNVPYWEHGNVLIDALAEIDYLLRDSRNDKVHSTDPAMLDILFAMRKRLGTRSPIYVVCGYRSPETNEMLAEQGSGVAKNSYHMAGKAIDIRMPDRDIESIRTVALDLRAGGVGYYPRSDFVHIDSGPVRSWS